MRQLTFFARQEKTPPVKKEDLTGYYIPIVETISTIQHISSWKYARNPLVARMFYSSLDELTTQEVVDAKRATVSCYKVMLNQAQVALLEQSKRIGHGYLMALNFMPKDILACINISATERNEMLNPFYLANELATGSSYAI